MNWVFYISAAVAVIATLIVITEKHPVHALLYLIVSLLAVSLVFYTLGAALVAALEVIIYAGAIMVLFVFVIMMLNLGPQSVEQESQWLRPRSWIGPGVLGAVLLAEVVYTLSVGGGSVAVSSTVSPRQVGIVLFGPYLVGVELASMVLLAGLVGAYHLGRRDHDAPEGD